MTNFWTHARRRFFFWVACATVLTAPLGAFADATTGTWTGTLQLRGNYYWEKSTRVIAPEGSVDLSSPTGIRLGADYLVDSITSASQAAGVLTDIRFTEVRHQISVRGGYEFDLGDAMLDLNLNYRFSLEPDYFSNSGGLSAKLSLFDRSTVLSLALGYVHDEIRQKFRAGTNVRPNFMSGTGATTADAFEENFDGLTVSVGLEQTLSKYIYAQIGYQYGYLNGFLANAYRRVSVVDVLRPESHPETRHRHTLSGRLAGRIPATNTTLHLGYAAYLDNWDIAAIAPEFRVYQDITRSTSFRLTYRFYTQREAYFYQDAYAMDTPSDSFVTADPKMSRFHVHTLGTQALLKLNFLEGTPLDFFSRGTIDITFDYRWNTNRFGNSVIGMVGASVPF